MDLDRCVEPVPRRKRSRKPAKAPLEPATETSKRTTRSQTLRGDCSEPVESELVRIPVNPKPAKKKQKTAKSKPTKAEPRPNAPYKGMSSRIAEKKLLTFQFRIGLPDKGFTEQTIKEYAFISDVVEAQGITKLCKIPSSYNLTLVREFYAELAANKIANSVTVRGVQVMLKSKRFNEMYDLHPPKHTEFHRLSKHATVEDLAEVAEVVGKPGAKWEPHTNFMLRVFKACNLNSNANVWINFIRHTVAPTTHDSSICVERMLLLYCLMAGKSINIGKCMLKGIRLCSNRFRGKLYLPYTITKLLKKSGVPIYSNDQIVREDSEKWEIDMKTVARLRDRKEKEKETGGTEMMSMVQNLLNQNSTLIQSLVDQKREFEEKMEEQQQELAKVMEKAESETKAGLELMRESMEAEYAGQIVDLKRRVKELKEKKKALKKKCRKLKKAASQTSTSK